MHCKPLPVQLSYAPRWSWARNSDWSVGLHLSWRTVTSAAWDFQKPHGSASAYRKFALAWPQTKEERSIAAVRGMRDRAWSARLSSWNLCRDRSWTWTNFWSVSHFEGLCARSLAVRPCPSYLPPFLSAKKIIQKILSKKLNKIADALQSSISISKNNLIETFSTCCHSFTNRSGRSEPDGLGTKIVRNF